MTREQVLETLKEMAFTAYGHRSEALDMAISALSAEPCDDYISRKDAIQALKAEGLEELCRSLGVYPWNVIKMIPSVQPINKWIPVSKRLPEEEHEVYCQLSDGSNAVLYVQDNWGQMEWVDGMMGTGTYDVVAWREKPEPYKKGGE